MVRRLTADRRGGAVRHRWPAFEDRPFDPRPPAGAAGFGLRDLVSYGRAAGTSGPGFASRVRGRWYAGQLRQASRTAIAAGVNGTPTVEGERQDTRHE